MKNIEFMGNTELGKLLYELNGKVHEVAPMTIQNEETKEVCPLCVDEFINRVHHEVFLDNISIDKRQIVIDSYHHFKKLYPDCFCPESELEERINQRNWDQFGNVFNTIFDPMRTSVSIMLEGFYNSRCFGEFEEFCMTLPSGWVFNLHNAIRDTLKNIGYDATNKQGRFSKRFVAYFYRTYKYKFSAEQLSRIGNIYNHCLLTNKLFYFEVTNNFTWDDGYYGKSGSCWWGCYTNSRDTLYYYGGYGLLFYPNAENTDEQDGIARFWVLPLNDHQIVGFNAYGIQEKEAAAAIAKLLEQKTGKTWIYGKREFKNTGRDSDYPYINTSNCYIVYESGHAPASNETIYFQFDRQAGYFSDDERTSCSSCGDYLDEGDEYMYDGEVYCHSCYDDLNLCSCYECGREFQADGMNTFQDREYCPRCYDRLNISACDRCGEMFYIEELHQFSDDDNQYCEYCFDREISLHCNDCGEDFCHESGEQGSDDELYCHDCIDNHRPEPEESVEQLSFIPSLNIPDDVVE